MHDHFQRVVNEIEEKAIKDIAKIRAEANEAISALETQRRRYASLTKEQRLAIAMHDVLCKLDHAAACAWLYEIGNNFSHDWHGQSHRSWLSEAEMFIHDLGEISVDDAVVVLTLVKGKRY